VVLPYFSNPVSVCCIIRMLQALLGPIMPDLDWVFQSRPNSTVLQNTIASQQRTSATGTARQTSCNNTRKLKGECRNGVSHVALHRR
jgi:hypothetical protein